MIELCAGHTCAILPELRDAEAACGKANGMNRKVAA